MKSWKTTAAAVITAVATLLGVVLALLDGDPTTTFNLDEAMAALTGLAVAFGFWKARDDDVSSEGTVAKKNE